MKFGYLAGFISMIRFAVCCLFLAAPTSGLHAASLFVGSYVSGPVPAAAGGLEVLTDSDDRYSDDTVVTGLSRSAAAVVDQGGTAYEAAASADLATGQLTTSVRNRAAISAPAPVGAANTAWPNMEAFETFSVAGNGSVEFRIDLTGAWDIGGLEPLEPDFSRLVLYGGFYLGTPSGAEERPFFRVIEEGPSARLSGSVSDTLSFTQMVADGETYGFNTFFFSSLEGSSGDSSVDWSGILSVTPRGGAAIRFSDPAFLAGTPPAPVPLPASGLLLLGALAAVTLLRNRPLRR